MADIGLPEPFANAEHKNEVSQGYITLHSITVNGQDVIVQSYATKNGWVKSFNLPSGGTISNSVTLRAGTVMKEQIITAEDQGGFPRYSYSNDDKGIEFKKQDFVHGPEKIIQQKDFLVGVKSIAGPYDSGYATILTNAFNSLQASNKKPNPKQSGVPVETRLRVTTDGKATVVEEIMPQQTGISPANSKGIQSKITDIYIQGDKYKVPDGFKVVPSGKIKSHSVGNDLPTNFETQLAKTLPKEAMAKFKQDMNKGNVTLDAYHVEGDVVCRAIVAKLDKGSPDLCDNNGVRR